MAEVYVPIFLDWIEQTQELNDQERGRLINAIVLYARGGDWEQAIKGNERYVFPAFRVTLERHRRMCAERAEAGRTGGKANRSKRKQTEQSEATITRTITNTITNTTTPYSPPSPEIEPIPCTVESYATSNLDRMSPGNMQELETYREDLPDDLIMWAIDEAAANTARSWAYVRSILNELLNKGITTLGEAKAASDRKRKRKRVAQQSTDDDNPALKAKWY